MEPQYNPAPPPHHPAVPALVSVLIVVILAGAYLVFADYRGIWPYSPSPSPAAAVEYRNEQYGFSVTLPESWRGFTTFTEQDDIWAIEVMNVIASYPIISLRHPLWTTAKPRQDIPIMVLTGEQWSRIKSEEWSVGAAPIPPSPLASNSQYVFALPARYNYAFPDGWEEVEQVLAARPVKAF